MIANRDNAHSSIDFASQINEDPIIFFGASGIAIDSGVVTAPAMPENKHFFSPKLSRQPNRAYE